MQWILLPWLIHWAHELELLQNNLLLIQLLWLAQNYIHYQILLYFRYNAATGGTGRIGYNNTPQVNDGDDHEEQ